MQSGPQCRAGVANGAVVVGRGDRHDRRHGFLETHIYLVVGIAVAVGRFHADAVVALDECDGGNQFAGIGTKIEIGKPRTIDQQTDGVAVGNIINGSAHFYRVASYNGLIGRGGDAHSGRLWRFYRFFGAPNAHGGLIAAVGVGYPNGDVVVTHHQIHRCAESAGTCIESEIVAAGAVHKEGHILAARHFAHGGLNIGRNFGGRTARCRRGDAHGRRIALHHRATVSDGDAVAGLAGAVAGGQFYGVRAFVERHGGPECFSGSVKFKSADAATIDVQTDAVAGFYITHFGLHSGGVDGGFAAVFGRGNAHNGLETTRFVANFGIGGIGAEVVAGAHPNAVNTLAQIELGRNGARAGIVSEVAAHSVHRQFDVVFAQYVAHRCAESEYRFAHGSLPARRIADGHARRIAHRRRRRRRQYHAFQNNEHIGIGRTGGVFGGDDHLVAAFLQPEVEGKLLPTETEWRLAAVHATIHIAGAAHIGNAGAHQAVGVVGVVRAGGGRSNVNDGRQQFGLGRRTETVGNAEVGIVVHVFVGGRPLVPVQQIGAGKREAVPGVQTQRGREVKAEFYAK